MRKCNYCNNNTILFLNIYFISILKKMLHSSKDSFNCFSQKIKKFGIGIWNRDIEQGMEWVYGIGVWNRDL